MVSKMISDRQKLADDALSWAAVHGPSISQAVVARLGADGDPEALIQQLVKELQRARKDLVATDEAHTQEAADDAEPRARRNDLGIKVTRTLVDVRAMVEPAYGPAGLAAIGLQAKLPKDPRQLARVVERFLQRTKAAGFKLPKPKREGTEVRISVYVKELEANYKPFLQALEDVQREESEFDATLLAKNNAMAKFNDVFGDFVAAMSTFARLGGQPELADKLPSLWWRTSSASDEALVDEGDTADDGVDEGEPPADA